MKDLFFHQSTCGWNMNKQGFVCHWLCMEHWSWISPSRFQEIAPPPALPQVPFSPTRAELSNAVPSRPGYGKAVELASAVMCPMKHNSTVMEVWDEEVMLGVVVSKIFPIFHPDPRGNSLQFDKCAYFSNRLVKNHQLGWVNVLFFFPHKSTGWLVTIDQKCIGYFRVLNFDTSPDHEHIFVRSCVVRCSQIRVPIRRSWRGLHHGCAEIGRRQLWSSLRSDTTPYWTKTSLQTSGHPDGDGDLEFLGGVLGVDLVGLMDILPLESTMNLPEVLTDFRCHVELQEDM